jgi:hypothetical protein
LFTYFSKFKGVPEKNIVLKYYGMSLKPSDTPESNFMNDEDTIEAVIATSQEDSPSLETKTISNSNDSNTSIKTKSNFLPLKQNTISIDLDDDDDFVPNQNSNNHTTMSRINTEILTPLVDTIKLKVKDDKGEKKYKIGKVTVIITTILKLSRVNLSESFLKDFAKKEDLHLEI